MNLVIVESPTKAKTITKFLGSKYKIESSFGHIRDLPKSDIGVDVDNDFTPKYVIPTKARKNLNKLKNLAKKANNIILATDEDREGEAIAWHLTAALKIDPKDAKRIVFHEITKNAIQTALESPRALNMKLIDAQQARRVLDRLVGYKLSPFLWKKVARGLSAGRVQSVAVRLIVEREREIQAFKPQEYWSIEASLSRLDEAVISEDQALKAFTARLNKINNKTIDKMEIKNTAAAEKITKDLNNAGYIVTDLIKKQNKKNPPSPFTTSTLQQTANRWLGYGAKQTMVLAQQLYENGHITYMRTDSLALSNKFLNDAHDYLHKNLGEKYTLIKARQFKTKSKSAQEAHEAIRPTEAENVPEKLKQKLNDRQLRLYRLIWQRSIASQMPAATMNAATIDIDAKKTPYQFRATGQTTDFDGYLKIYPERSKELELPSVKKHEKLELHDLSTEQHYTKPPARYSDAGLVKILEKHGIGRPSTYAPTISTIETRNYVQRDENKKLAPTDIAFVVNDLLVEHFPKIVDFQFTAEMENDLDKIADGRAAWQPIIKNFYQPFQDNLEIKYNEINKKDIMPEETSNEKCDKCGAPMIIKTGRYGKFLACSAFPDCKNIKGMPGSNNGQNNNDEKKQDIKKLEKKYNGEKCDKCGADMVIKNGRFGPFLACSAYPKCKNIKNIKENNSSTGIKCPACGQGEIVQKRSKRGIFYACNQYPDCKNAYWGKPTGEKCPDCGALLIETKNNEVKCSAKGCGYTK
ncbi:MAG: type I DNA topoisomerase [Patescibacteria group bacterium]|nr:type I DNA topoisomerase [Patescibacteria group bacterium]